MELVVLGRSKPFLHGLGDERLLAPLLRPGCIVRRTAAPFDHSKLMTVDGAWAAPFGSANWGGRAAPQAEFRVFGLLEVYSSELCGDAIDGIIDGRSSPAPVASPARRTTRPPDPRSACSDAAARLALALSPRKASGSRAAILQPAAPIFVIDAGKVTGHDSAIGARYRSRIVQETLSGLRYCRGNSCRRWKPISIGRLQDGDIDYDGFCARCSPTWFCLFEYQAERRVEQ